MGQAFERAIGLPVSKKKTRVVASSVKLGAQVAEGLAVHGCKRARSVLVLGVEHTAGTGGAQRQGKVRMDAFAKRKQRFVRLKKLRAKIGTVMRAAGNPAVQYGARAVGLAPSVLARLRSSMVLGLPARTKSASVTLQYKLCGKEHRDPTLASIMAPIMFIARLAFGSTAAHGELQMVVVGPA